MPSRQKEFNRHAEDASGQLLVQLQRSAQGFRTNEIFTLAPEQYKARQGDADCTLAAWCLRYSKSEGKNYSLRNLRKRVNHLFTVAAKHAHRNPKEWAKSEVDRQIDKVFPLDGPASRADADGEISAWLHEELHEYIEEADIEWFKRTPREESEQKSARQSAATLDKKRKAAMEEESIFRASADYRSINYKGTAYTLTRNQSKIIKLLHEANESGTPDLGQDTLLAAIEQETSRVRDSFKNSGLWGKLVIPSRRRGTFRLNLK